MWRFVLFGALALLAAPVLAQSDTGYVVTDVNLRAGPDIGYPLIDVVPAGGPVYINGCTEAYAWCDVVFQGEHGWIDGNYIQHDYDNRPVVLPRYGAAIGVPIISFSIGTYWNRWYGNRPFYRERHRWYRYSPPHLLPYRTVYRGGDRREDRRHPDYPRPPGHGYSHPQNRDYHGSRQDHQRHSQQPVPHASPYHPLPPRAMRPTAGPIHAVPLNRRAPQTAPSHGGTHRGDDSGHGDHRGGHGIDHGH